MARNDGTKQSDSDKQAKPAAARPSPDNTQRQKAIADDEGMAPRPDQASDDIASPGTLPRSDRANS